MGGNQLRASQRCQRGSELYHWVSAWTSCLRKCTHHCLAYITHKSCQLANVSARVIVNLTSALSFHISTQDSSSTNGPLKIIKVPDKYLQSQQTIGNVKFIHLIGTHYKSDTFQAILNKLIGIDVSISTHSASWMAKRHVALPHFSSFDWNKTCPALKSLPSQIGHKQRCHHIFK